MEAKPNGTECNLNNRFDGENMPIARIILLLKKCRISDIVETRAG